MYTAFKSATFGHALHTMHTHTCSLLCIHHARMHVDKPLCLPPTISSSHTPKPMQVTNGFRHMCCPHIVPMNKYTLHAYLPGGIGSILKQKQTREGVCVCACARVYVLMVVCAGLHKFVCRFLYNISASISITYSCICFATDHIAETTPLTITKLGCSLLQRKKGKKLVLISKIKVYLQSVRSGIKKTQAATCPPLGNQHARKVY